MDSRISFSSVSMDFSLTTEGDEVSEYNTRNSTRLVSALTHANPNISNQQGEYDFVKKTQSQQINKIQEKVEKFLYIDSPCSETQVMETFSILKHGIKYSVPKLLPINKSSLLARRKHRQESQTENNLGGCISEAIDIPHVSLKVSRVKQILRSLAV